MQFEIVENPHAPKVPFGSGRDEWTVCQSGTASAGHARPGRAPKSARDFGNLHVLQIGPTSSKCTVSIRHGRNIGPTWGQLRHNLDPLGSNHLAPRWRNSAPTWTHLGATSAEVGDIAGRIRNPQNACFHWCFHTFFCFV